MKNSKQSGNPRKVGTPAGGKPRKPPASGKGMTQKAPGNKAAPNSR